MAESYTQFNYFCVHVQLKVKNFLERYIIDLVFFILNFQLYVMVKLLMAKSHHQEVGLYQ